MAKSKKSKRRSAPKRSMREVIRAYQDLLFLGNRRGEEAGVYQRTFLLPDEKEVREIENTLSPAERRVFRTWMLCNTPFSTMKGLKANSIVEYLMNRQSRTWRCIFAASIIGGIHELWSSDGSSGLPEYKGLEDVEKQFAASLKKHFQNPHPEIYREQIENLIYSDHKSARLSCMVDWESFLPGENPVRWSKNGLELLERFAGEDQLAYLRDRRDTLIVSFAKFSAELIPLSMKSTADDMRALGIPCSYGVNAGVLPPLKEDIATNFDALVKPDLRGSFNTGFGLPPGAQITEENAKTNDALCQGTLLRFISSDGYEVLSRRVTGLYTGLEILYAALSLMAIHPTVTAAPAAAQTLFSVITLTGFPSNIVDYGYTQRDQRKRVRLDTTRLIGLDEDQRRKFRKIFSDENSEMEEWETDEIQNINLAQFIFSNTGAIVPPTLTIGLREARVLESCGLSRTESLALCGYMEGLRSLTCMLVTMADNWEPPVCEDEEEESGPTEEERRHQIRHSNSMFSCLHRKNSILYIIPQKF